MSKYEKCNHYYGKYGVSLPEDMKIEDVKKEYVDITHLKFLGLFREYTPLARTTTHFNNDLVLEIRKDTRKSISDFTLIPIVKTGGGYHGSDFNNNGGFSISKQSLQQIVNQMDDADELVITSPDTLDRQAFDKVVKQIKGK